MELTVESKVAKGYINVNGIAPKKERKQRNATAFRILSNVKRVRQ
jgi:hypothetical protein